MVREERVALMAKMQAYEDRGGKKDIAITSWFRGDYIGAQVLKSVICMTIASALFFAGYVFYHMEQFMKDLYHTDWVAYAGTLAVRYAILVAGYAVITYLIYAYRYVKAKKNLKKYYGKLKELNAMYHKES